MSAIGAAREGNPFEQMTPADEQAEDRAPDSIEREPGGTCHESEHKQDLRQCKRDVAREIADVGTARNADAMGDDGGDERQERRHDDGGKYEGRPTQIGRHGQGPAPQQRQQGSGRGQ